MLATGHFYAGQERPEFKTRFSDCPYLKLLENF